MKIEREIEIEFLSLLKSGPSSASVACFPMGNESVLAKFFRKNMGFFLLFVAFTAEK